MKNSALLRAISYAAAAQVITSGTSFGLNAVLLLLQTREEFGKFGVGFSASLLVGGAASALLAPFSVLIQGASHTRRLAFAFDTLSLGAGISIALVVSAWAISLSIGQSTQGIAAAVGFVSAAYLFRDAALRMAHALNAERLVLDAAIVTMIAIAVLALALYGWAGEFSALHALLSYAASSLAGSFWIYVRTFGFRTPRIRRVVKTFNMLWPSSKWNLLASLAYNVRAQAYALLTAPVLGLAAVGALNAARMLIQPAILALPVVSQVFLPRLTPAQLTFERLRLMMGGAAVIVFFYAGGIFAVMRLDLITAYVNKDLVLPWLIVLLLVTLRTCAYLYVEVRGLYRHISIANLVSAVVIIPATYVLATVLGVVGAAYAIAVVEAVLLALVLIPSKSAEIL